jgi:hypothetical protein
MEMKEYFFSKKNLLKLASELGYNFEIEENDTNAMKVCQKMLYEKVMPNIWDKFKNNVGKHPPKKVISYLNKKSLELSQEIWNNKSQRSVSQIGVDRENEISGKRGNKVTKHPQATRVPHQPQRQPQQKGPGGMDSGFSSGGGGFGGFADFNSIDNISGPSPYITAYGGVGSDFNTRINVNDYVDGGKKKKESQNDIESRLAEQMEERGMNPSMMGGGGNMGGGNMGGGNMSGGNMGGGDDMQNMFGYNPNPFGKRRVDVPRINFCIDGGDTRGAPMDENGNKMEPIFTGYDGNNMGDYGGLNNGMENEYGGDMPDMMNMGGMNGMNMGGMNGMNMGGMNMNKMNQNNQQNNNGNNSQMEQIMLMLQTMMAMNGNGGTNVNVNGNNNDNDYNDYEKMYNKKSNDFKKSIASKFGVDPQSLNDLSADQISKMIKSNQKNDNSSDSDSDSDSDNYKKNKKKNKKKEEDVAEKIKQLRLLKEMNLKQQKKINKVASKRKDSDSDSESNSESEEEKPKQNLKQKKKKVLSSDSESEEETQIKPTKKTSNAPVVNTKKTIIIKSKNKANTETEPSVAITKMPILQNASTLKIKSEQMIIKCDKIEEVPLRYNDYMVDFGEQFPEFINVVEKEKGEEKKFISGIKKITIEKIELDFVPKITESVNTFSVYQSDDDNYENVLNPGEYTIDEIIEGFNENYESEGCGIVITKKNGFITIKQNDDEVFDMDCSNENSIGHFLGFKNKKYTNSSKYISETRHAFNESPIYLYILNINQKSPFAKINPDGTVEQFIKDFPKPIKEEYFVIQFRSKDTNEDDDEKELINLGCSPHKIILKLEIATPIK